MKDNMILGILVSENCVYRKRIDGDRERWVEVLNTNCDSEHGWAVCVSTCHKLAAFV